MNILKITIQVCVLYGFYTAGGWIQDWLNLFIPGSIIGMILLFLCLLFNLFPLHVLEEGTGLILRHMPLLFVPITVGVINFLDLFLTIGIGLFFIAMFSTVLVMGITGILCQFIVKKKEIQL
ncbi:CidA/LrgA family protein [Halalkalibacter urbisdiaboli]|uniref:CidA/LrgA family protein n=1 Tax=Halalkalibacter urbisdiaboli TaxID=1960589 RepID=UPI000B44DD85|nr:CidA/LrgA family protein [Halalkalibacter urbisdiaboli]